MPPVAEVSRPLGNSFRINITLGFLIQIIVTIVSAVLLFTAAKSDSREAINMGKDAIEVTKENTILLNEFNQRLMKLETRQEDFQSVYERDANKYIRDFNDRYNKLNGKQ